MEKIVLPALTREDTKPNAIREAKRIPAIIYGKKFENKKITLDYLEFLKLYRVAGESTIIHIDLEGAEIPVLVHEVQTDPVYDRFIHIDFQAIQKGQEIHTHVPIHLDGVSEAVKTLGGILVHDKETLEIKCLPENLLSEIVVDISSIKTFHDSITVADLQLPDTITVLDAPESIVVSVSAPKEEKEEEVAVEEEKAGEGKEEGEESE